jgi:hypothetical protein
MRYFKINYAKSRRNSRGIDKYEPSEFNYRVLSQGETLININKLKIFFSSDIQYDDQIFNKFGLFIVSGKVAKILRPLKGIQIFPKIAYSTNDPNKHYDVNIINITNIIPALDLEKSGYSISDPKKIMDIHRIVIDPSKLISEPDIFRLNEFKPDIFISERLKNLLELENVTGFNFKLVAMSDDAFTENDIVLYKEYNRKTKEWEYYSYNTITNIKHTLFTSPTEFRIHDFYRNK